MEAYFEKAQSYEDLISQLFCTDCFHLIEDHFKFESTGEIRCEASESIDGFFKTCNCKTIETSFRITLKIEDFLEFNEKNNVAPNI